MIQRRLEREKYASPPPNGATSLGLLSRCLLTYCRKNIFTGKPIDELPFYTREQVAELCSKKGEQLVIEGDIFYFWHHSLDFYTHRFIYRVLALRLLVPPLRSLYLMYLSL